MKWVFVILLFSSQVFAQSQLFPWQTDFNTTLVSNRILNKGETLYIPTQFAPQGSNQQLGVGNSANVLGWLREARNLPTRSWVSGTQTKIGYFVPVQDKQGNKGWVELKDLTIGQSADLNVNNTTSFYTPEPKKAWQEPGALDKSPNGDDICCHPSLLAEQQVIDELTEDTRDILAALEDSITQTTARSVANRGEITDVIANFNGSCMPYTFKKFYEEMKKQATANHIPLDMLLGIMTQETAGTCHRNRSEENGTVSVGLFQINSRSAKLPICNNDFANEQCLQNPYGNLKEAIRIIKQKYKTINEKYPAQNGLHNFDDLNLNQRNLWRKAIAAYNGGEGHVMQAYNDVQAFNRQYNLELDADDWEVRRIFMLRRAVERNGGTVFRTTVASPIRRSTNNTIYNLSYVDSIVHPEIHDQGNSQALKWVEYIENN